MKRQKQQTNPANHNCVGFLLGIFNGEKFSGYLFLEESIVDDKKSLNVIVLDENGNVTDDKFEGDVYVLTVTDSDFRADCKAPGGSDKYHSGEDIYQTLSREICEETDTEVFGRTLFHTEKYYERKREHTRYFFSIIARSLPQKREKRYTTTGNEKLKVYWLPITSFVCSLFKNQRRSFKELLQNLLVNKTFFEKYEALIKSFDEISR